MSLGPSAKTWLNRIGAFLGLAGVVFVGIKLHDYADVIDLHRMTGSSYVSIAALVGLYGASNLLLALGWRRLMNHAGATISRPWAIYAYAISQLAKYVPGNIFQFAGRQALGLAAGIANAPLVRSTVYELAFLIVGGFLFSPLVLPLMLTGLPNWLGWISFVVATAIGLWLAVRIGGADFGAAAACYLGFLGLSGVVFAVACGLAGGPGDVVLYPAIAGAYVVAWLVGLVTPGAPAGIGIREAVLLFLLGALDAGPTILLAVVIGRTISVLGDLMFFFGGQLTSWYFRAANERRS